MDAPVELTERQQNFVAEYLVDLNATQAAIRAGYAEDSAFVEGSRQLSKVKVRSAIKKALDDRRRRIGVTADEALQLLLDHARANLDDIVQVHEDGRVTVLPDTEWGPSRAAVQEVRSGKYGPTVKLAGKDRVLALLCQHLGLTGPDLVDRLRELLAGGGGVSS